MVPEVASKGPGQRLFRDRVPDKSKSVGIVRGEKSAYRSRDAYGLL